LELAPICFEELDSLLMLTANEDQSLNYLWNSGEVTNAVEALQEGTYMVTLSRSTGTDGYVCAIDDQVVLREFCPYTFYVPNAFSPDDAGSNDIFYAYGTHIVEFELVIYDRWGLKLFTSNDINVGWNGRYLGRTVQQDVYVWKAVYTVETYDGTTEEKGQTGTVTVVK
jgi:gliding motility-associated-like protein